MGDNRSLGKGRVEKSLLGSIRDASGCRGRLQSTSRFSYFIKSGKNSMGERNGGFKEDRSGERSR